MMTMYELAGMLDGSTYGNEVNKETAELAKENGLVIVFGASDDLMEFRGAIDDEADVYEGGTVYLDESGLFRARDCSGDESRCPYLIAARDRCKTIAAMWNKRGSNWAWEYETDIPHADFRVFDGDDNSPYCLGIVFSVEDLKRKTDDAIPVSFLQDAMNRLQSAYQDAEADHIAFVLWLWGRKKEQKGDY